MRTLQPSPFHFRITNIHRLRIRVLFISICTDMFDEIETKTRSAGSDFILKRNISINYADAFHEIARVFSCSQSGQEVRQHPKSPLTDSASDVNKSIWVVLVWGFGGGFSINLKMKLKFPQVSRSPTVRSTFSSSKPSQ